MTAFALSHTGGSTQRKNEHPPFSQVMNLLLGFRFVHDVLITQRLAQKHVSPSIEEPDRLFSRANLLNTVYGAEER